MASGSYVAVGWDAAQDLGYDEIVDLRFKATVFNVFNKVLFDYIDDKSTVNINFIAAEADDYIQLEEAGKMYKDSGFCIKGFVNGVYTTKRYTVNITGHMVFGILYSSFEESIIQENHDLVIVVDNGKFVCCMAIRYYYRVRGMAAVEVA